MPLEKRFKEWARQYVEQGRRKGELEGMARALEWSLTGGFGVLPQSVVDKIKASRDEEELISWALRALHAKTLAEVFEDAPS